MIDQQAISDQIKQMVENTKTMKQEEAEQAFADQLAQVITKALLSADVKVQVQTVGTATAQSGTGTGKLS
jgi:hypothetical protein